MCNLDVALAGFWQIFRHREQGDTAMLELSCKAGSLLMELTAKLGHPQQLFLLSLKRSFRFACAAKNAGARRLLIRKLKETILKNIQLIPLY